MTTTMAVTLRPATAADEAFLRALYASTREAELAQVPWTDEQKAAFVAMQFRAQSTHYATYYPDARHDVVEIDGEPAGRLYVDRRPTEIDVVDIALLPAYRGRGVGEQLLRDLIAEARATGRSVAIMVEHDNPARRLYERLGFEPDGAAVGIHFPMRVR